MTALAHDLAVVLVDRDGDDATLARVDEALAEALAALESLTADHAVASLPAGALDAVVELVVQLLVELRVGHLDRITCRAMASLVLERVARCFGATGPVEPLVRVLGALAALPEGPEDRTRALDPRPDPELPVEVALASMLDGDDRDGLLDAIAAGTVHLPVLHLGADDTTVELRLLPIIGRDGPLVCAFTSLDRWHDHVADAGVSPPPTIELTGAELVDLWPAGHGLAINAGSVLGTVVAEREVRALPSRV